MLREVTNVAGCTHPIVAVAIYSTGISNTENSSPARQYLETRVFFAAKYKIQLFTDRRSSSSGCKVTRTPSNVPWRWHSDLGGRGATAAITAAKKEISMTIVGSQGRLACLFGIARLLATSLVIGPGHAQSTFNHLGNILITDRESDYLVSRTSQAHNPFG